jgi:Putative zinc-finger
MTAEASHLSLDSSGHPDIETLSEYVEELLTPQAAAELAAHLTSCADCRESRDTLDEIRALLGQTEFPPIPDDVALRIDAALAAEADHARADAAKPAQAALRTSEAATARPAARTSPGGSAGPSSPAHPARPGGAGPGRARLRRLRQAALGVAALAACGLVVTAALHIHPNVSSASRSDSAAVPKSGGADQGNGTRFTAFSRTGFPQQIQSLLAAPGAAQPQAQSGGQAAARGTGKGTSGGTAGAASGPETGAAAGVPSCVLAAVPHQGEPLLAATLGSYQGDQVYALVYPDPTDPAHAVEAFLVDFDCATPAGHDGPVLLSGTVPRR